MRLSLGRKQPSGTFSGINPCVEHEFRSQARRPEDILIQEGNFNLHFSLRVLHRRMQPLRSLLHPLSSYQDTHGVFFPSYLLLGLSWDT